MWAERPIERVCRATGRRPDLPRSAPWTNSRLFETGLNPMEVAAITGHKILQMLKRYARLRAGGLVGGWGR